MIYRIEYANGCCKFANSSKDLIKCVDVLEGVHITDIRKLYKNGVSDSVLETYGKYIRR